MKKTGRVLEKKKATPHSLKDMAAASMILTLVSKSKARKYLKMNFNHKN
jgi:hypothetical protein